LRGVAQPQELFTPEPDFPIAFPASVKPV